MSGRKSSGCQHLCESFGEKAVIKLHDGTVVFSSLMLDGLCHPSSWDTAGQILQACLDLFVVESCSWQRTWCGSSYVDCQIVDFLQYWLFYILASVVV